MNNKKNINKMDDDDFVNLNNLLNNKNLDLNLIKEQIYILNDFNESAKYKYLKDLLYPEKCKDARIPCETPFPSCTFQLRSSVVHEIHFSDRFLFRINPFFLASNDYKDKEVTLNFLNRKAKMLDVTETNYCPNGWQTDDSSLTTWNVLRLNQTIEKNIYTMYRLVSACVKVEYLGSIPSLSGTIGGSIVYETQFNTLSSLLHVESRDGELWTEVTSFTKFEPYQNINRLRQATFNCEHNLADGIRMLYFPVDNTYNEFYRVFDGEEFTMEYENDYNRPVLKTLPEYHQNGFNWFIYGCNIPNFSKFRVELYCNFECIPNPKMLNFIPVESKDNYIEPEEKTEIIKLIQKNCIKKYF